MGIHGPKHKAIPEGTQFGEWVIIQQAPNIISKGGYSRIAYFVRCNCGTEKVLSIQHLKKGKSNSCGCQTSELMSQSGREHGMSDTTTYQTWAGMWQRCINPKNGNFKWYGARGISVCPEWRNFSVFFKDMGEQPSNRTLDREDNNGNYGPENCRWATKKVQNQNTRRATFVTVHGQRLCTTDAAKALNVDPSGVWAYVRRHGGTLQQAIDYYAAKSSFFQLPKEPTP